MSWRVDLKTARRIVMLFFGRWGVRGAEVIYGDGDGDGDGDTNNKI